MSNAPALIALDWGTSSLRAYLLDHNGAVLQSRTKGPGIMRVKDGNFAAALTDFCHGWPNLPRLACGMIGSRQGWHEAPYLPCPADVSALAAQLLSTTSSNGDKLLLVPGVRRVDDSGVSDVMRGEETQILGAHDANAAAELFVLPGTHSKWVLVERGSISWFCTFLSGELYQVLSEHSILGKMITADAAPTDEAFDRGVAAGLSGPLLRQLFSARTLALDEQLKPGEVSAYLSGLIIGAEIRQAIAACPVAPTEVTLIATQHLTSRYLLALARAGVHARPGPADAAAAGLAQIATAAGILTS